MSSSALYHYPCISAVRLLIAKHAVSRQPLFRLTNNANNIFFRLDIFMCNIPCWHSHRLTGTTNPKRLLFVRTTPSTSLFSAHTLLMNPFSFSTNSSTTAPSSLRLWLAPLKIPLESSTTPPPLFTYPSHLWTIPSLSTLLGTY